MTSINSSVMKRLEQSYGGRWSTLKVYLLACGLLPLTISLKVTGNGLIIVKDREQHFLNQDANKGWILSNVEILGIKERGGAISH